MADPRPPSVSLATHDGRLRVDFRWERDRFVHQIFVDQQEAGRSLEGGTDDPWPLSPPIQQLSLEEIQGSNVILGVGAAGRSHWSMSVELDREGDVGWIKFDLACRSNDQPRFLGSTYQISESIALTPADANLVVDGQTVTIRSVTQEASTHRWTYRVDAN